MKRNAIFKKYLCAIVLALVATASFAQKTDRDYLRRGNRYYRDSLFQKAEVNYRKALEKNPQSAMAMYNLGNSLLMQQKAEEAMKQYDAASKIERDKGRAAQIFHNAGVIFQSQKQYAEAADMYKQALRNNPADNETRYNLALCQRMLKKDKQEDKKKDDKSKKDKQEEKKKDDKSDKDKDKDKDKKDETEKQQKQQQQKDQMSKENAEQMLNAAMQEEKNTQNKLKKAMAPQRSRQLEKNW